MSNSMFRFGFPSSSGNNISSKRKILDVKEGIEIMNPADCVDVLERSIKRVKITCSPGELRYAKLKA